MVRLITKRIFYSILFLGSNSLVAQNKIIVSANRNIPTGVSGYIVGEPHLAINPNNPNHLLIGAMLINPSDTKDGPCISLVSTDRGKTWEKHIFRFKSAADPWCLITDKGEAVFSLLGEENLWTYHSKNGGRTWIDSTDLGKYQDHEAMTMDKNTKNIYLTSVQSVRSDNKSRSSVFIARSSDGGKTFPYRKNIIHNDFSLNTMTPVVLSNGTLLVPYDEFSYKGSSGYTRLKRSLSWFISSTDNGENFSKPQFITQSFGPSFPVLEIDRSSKHKDHLYLVGRSEDGKSILLFHSQKRAAWDSSLVYSSGNLNTVPNITINEKGIICITWYERTEGDNFCQTFKCTISYDGGRSFSKPVNVSQTYCPDKNKNGYILKRGWASGGHYTGLVALSSGNFYAVWADAGKGDYQLYGSEISIN